MIKLFSETEYQNARYKDSLLLRCIRCDKIFYRTKNSIRIALLKVAADTCEYCSSSCANGLPKQLVKCKQCGKEFLKESSRIKKTLNHFCSHSCAATYNNEHKTTGTRRSKLEAYLEEQLTTMYEFPIKFNTKTEINSELDIFVPHLRLAFELNGIYHYEPIHGKNLLEKTINNDNRKYQACAENNISLCTIDTSSQKYFKPESSKMFLNIITTIIDSKLHQAVPTPKFQSHTY